MEIIVKIVDENQNENPETNWKEITAKWFNDSCVAWTKDPEYNLIFLSHNQNYFNEKLKHVGHVFLNDVYDAIGLPKTKLGQVIGWIYEPGKRIDFGLYDQQNIDFINVLSRDALLKFNVDGPIIDKVY